MPINLSFSSVLKYLISTSPLYVTIFLVLGSLLNQDVKGLVYLGFVLIVTLAAIGLKKIFRGGGRPAGYTEDACQLFTYPELLTTISNPDLNSVFLAFTTTYLILPMVYGAAPLNALLIVFMGTLILGNAITRKSAGCNFISDLLVGNLVGAGLGVGFFYALWSKQENRHLLFTSDLGSNRVSCSRPSKQTFKCAVYKNGQLIKNL